MNKFYFKIILPSILSVLLFILTIFLIIIPHFQENIMNGKREMIKELTNSAWSILSKYENDERNGLLTREEAQTTAVSRIQYLRYGEENKDYFWITDLHPVMIMHPYRTDLNGKDLSSLSDPHGKKLFVEFVKTVKQSEHGYVDYMWQWKDDSLHIVPKLSYVKVFKPWGWVIGTGIYIEDVKKEISALTNKLLWISIGISVLIAFLLLFISQQSLKIERKRIEAENELNQSKEKYRTLVEAATEGLIMLIDGKISFSNNIISRITGFEPSELINSTLSLLLSKNNSKEIIETFSGRIIKEGLYELALNRKSGGLLEVLITSSTAMFYNKSVNILIVKDITIERKSDITNFDFQKLVSTLNIGFFRATIDFKGKFIFANETTLRILGFNNFRELSEVYILELLANAEDRKNLRKDLLENGVIKNKALKIQKKNGELAIVSVTLIVFNNNNSKDLICDGIIEDITLKEKEKSEKESLIVQLRAGNFIIEQPVKDYIIPAFSLGLDTTISEVICTLKNRKSDSVLIAKNEKEYIGFVTNSDIQNRVLALELNLDNPVYLIMSSPIIYINENSLIIDALNLCDEKKISHLVVKNDRDIVTGIFRMNDVYRFLKRSLSFFIENIKYSPSTEEIKNNYRMLMHLLKPIINSDISVKDITQITTTFSDAVNKRVVELAIQETGEPPVPFSLICLGSEGRKEETLLTDQDNAIIYDDVPKENEAEINNYFLSLGNKICTYLNDVGYSYCRGNIMAMNSQWCKPVSVWENYFLNWITTPEPQNLLDATIFFDFRIVYGDEELTGRLRNFINKLVNSQPLFLYHLAYNTYNIKCQQIAEKSTESIDLKNAVSLLVMFVRTYSLKYNINHTNTIDRLNSLIANQAIHTSTSSEILYVYNYLMKLRFKNQQFLADNNLPLSNILNPKRLIEIEQSVLKKVLSLIPAYQNKIGNDFRINI